MQVRFRCGGDRNRPTLASQVIGECFCYALTHGVGDQDSIAAAIQVVSMEARVFACGRWILAVAGGVNAVLAIAEASRVAGVPTAAGVADDVPPDNRTGLRARADTLACTDESGTALARCLAALCPGVGGLYGRERLSEPSDFMQ